MKKKPQWVFEKEQLSYHEEIIFIGERGVDGVIDGKLPNGEPYEWTKKHRRKLKKPKRM